MILTTEEREYVTAAFAPQAAPVVTVGDVVQVIMLSRATRGYGLADGMPQAVAAYQQQVRAEVERMRVDLWNASVLGEAAVVP